MPASTARRGRSGRSRPPRRRDRRRRGSTRGIPTSLPVRAGDGRNDRPWIWPNTWRGCTGGSDRRPRLGSGRSRSCPSLDRRTRIPRTLPRPNDPRPDPTNRPPNPPIRHRRNRSACLPSPRSSLSPPHSRTDRSPGCVRLRGRIRTLSTSPTAYVPRRGGIRRRRRSGGRSPGVDPRERGTLLRRCRRPSWSDTRTLPSAR
mmetsp:Transcript_35763/g.106738  ORF Transcript_35763/g.106738 Transcript_35763/m.106738 type:complete len:202 (-) Transcript_35763:13-618(-)